MNDLHKINREDKLYVSDLGNGYSCIGFDYADKIGEGLSKELGIEWAKEWKNKKLRKGTKRHYAQYCKMVDIAGQKHMVDGFRSEVCLTKSLKGVEGKRVKVTLKNGEQERFWVGRSTGFIPCHLMVKKVNSSGGCGVYFDDEDIEKVEVLK
jgi:hypothetical protein